MAPAVGWGRAGGLSVVLDHVLEVREDDGDFDPEGAFSHDQDAVRSMCLAGCEAVRVLAG